MKKKHKDLKLICEKCKGEFYFPKGNISLILFALKNKLDIQKHVCGNNFREQIADKINVGKLIIFFNSFYFNIVKVFLLFNVSKNNF